PRSSSRPPRQPRGASHVPVLAAVPSDADSPDEASAPQAISLDGRTARGPACSIGVYVAQLGPLAASGTSTRSGTPPSEQPRRPERDTDPPPPPCRGTRSDGVVSDPGHQSGPRLTDQVHPGRSGALGTAQSDLHSQFGDLQRSNGAVDVSLSPDHQPGRDP